MREDNVEGQVGKIRKGSEGIKWVSDREETTKNE